MASLSRARAGSAIHAGAGEQLARRPLVTSGQAAIHRLIAVRHGLSGEALLHPRTARSAVEATHVLNRLCHFDRVVTDETGYAVVHDLGGPSPRERR